jgi:class 3 adenylate cyclase
VVTAPDPGTPKESPEASQIIPNLEFRYLVAVDVQGFSQRSASEQARVQADLEHAMSEAAASAGLDRNLWYRQPRGDGELAVLPADTNGLSLVADYPRCLASIFAKINSSADDGSRLRARIAIHHGTVYPGPFGHVSRGPITVSVLVDARVLRLMLRQRTDLDIALIVSDTVYNEVVQSRFNGLDPKMFRRARIKIKEIRYVGYLYLADLN